MDKWLSGLGLGRAWPESNTIQTY